jgi:hypothetical protein
MIFYVRRVLSSGLVRFGAGERAESVPTSSSDPFSTGPAGEYRRRGEGGLYFAEERGVNSPAEVSSESEIRRLSSLSLVAKVVIGFGGLFLLWGVLLLLRKNDPVAWILIIAGVAMIGTPIFRTMKLRRELREQAEKERTAREEEERKRKEIVGAFSSSLEALRNDPGAATMQRVRRERETREIPYDAVAPLARDTALHIAFGILSRFQTLGADGVAREIDAVSDTVGLNDEDRRLVKRLLYQKIVWHLLADDRLNDAAATELKSLRKALGILDDEVAIEQSGIEQFAYLRGMRVGNLPSVDSPVPLKFREVCHHRSRGELRKPTRRRGGWKSAGERYVTVTSKRVVISNGKEVVIRYDEIFNLEVDADERQLTIQTTEDESHHLVIPDPIYTAAMIVMASETPLKPEGIV